MHAQPAARIGEALAHLESGEADARPLQIFTRGLAVAGERDDGDDPSALRQALSKRNDLTFRSTQAVETGNDEGDMAHGGGFARTERISSS